MNSSTSGRARAQSEGPGGIHCSLGNVCFCGVTWGHVAVVALGDAALIVAASLEHYVVVRQPKRLAAAPASLGSVGPGAAASLLRLHQRAYSLFLTDFKVAYVSKKLANFCNFLM